AVLPKPNDRKASTQEGFGKILNAIAAEDSELSRRIVTTSPDVSVSTNLGAWINRRGLFGHTEAEDVFREPKVVSAQLWRQRRRASEHPRAADRYRPAGALVLRAGLCRRACRADALRPGAHAAALWSRGWLVALSPPLDAQPAAARAHALGRTAGRYRARRLL